MNKPAPTSKSNERVTCATTRLFRKRPCEPPPRMPATWSFKVDASSGLVLCSAGASPKTIPVSTETAIVKARMRKSGLAEMTSLTDWSSQQAPICAFRSEEHTSELQSPDHLVFRLLLVK